MQTIIFHKFMRKASPQRGGALIYILIAIALLAALTTTFMGSGGQQSRTQNSFKLASELNSQARVIRSGIQDCILRFPQGDNAIVETGYIAPYPINPDSADAGYAAGLTALSVATPTTKEASELRCPGASYAQIFSGAGQFSSFLPTAPSLMEDWTYFNGGAGTGNEVTALGQDFDGVYFQIRSDKSDPFIGESMQKIDDSMAACEVNYTVGDDTNGCEDGFQCLRFWIIRNDGTDVDCDS